MVNIGDRFGRLEVLSVDTEREQELKNKKHARRFVMCRCECGNIVSVRADGLTGKSRPTRSCGCLQRERASAYMKEHPQKTKYGDSRERLHNIWYLMNDRCFNERSPAYKNYGGRGIKVSLEWANSIDGYFRFKQWALENGYTSTLTIDRINNDGDYSPSNCRWISLAEQASNTRRNAYIEWDGRKQTITQWARELGVEMNTLHNRLVRLGWPVERAMTHPYRQKSQIATARLTNSTVKNKICGEMNIAGIGAAQATSSGKLADSAKIARNASTIIMLQNKTPEEIEADGRDCGNKKLVVKFNRNGPQHADDEYIDMQFDGDFISYEEAQQHIPVTPY